MYLKHRKQKLILIIDTIDLLLKLIPFYDNLRLIFILRFTLVI